MNISIQYEDFIKLVRTISNPSVAQLENKELLNIFINTLADKKNKNDVISIFANALLLLPFKEIDNFLNNKKICEHITKFSHADKEKLILNLYTSKIKSNILNKVISSISYNKIMSVELNNSIEEHSKKIIYLKQYQLDISQAKHYFIIYMT